MAQASRFRRTAFATALALPLIALPLAAHHGWSNYGSEEFSISGAVETPVSLAGPHATMRIRAEGQVWNIVLSAGNRVAAAGLKEMVHCSGLCRLSHLPIPRVTQLSIHRSHLLSVGEVCL